MNRFEYALHASIAPEQETLGDLARGLVSAIEQTEAEGQIALSDPAVMVLGAYIAFHTHADVNSVKGYRQLLSLCEYRSLNPPELQ